MFYKFVDLFMFAAVLSLALEKNLANIDYAEDIVICMQRAYHIESIKCDNKHKFVIFNGNEHTKL